MFTLFSRKNRTFHKNLVIETRLVTHNSRLVLTTSSLNIFQTAKHRRGTNELFAFVSLVFRFITLVTGYEKTFAEARKDWPAGDAQLINRESFKIRLSVARHPRTGGEVNE